MSENPIFLTFYVGIEMKLWLEIDKLFKNLLGRNVLKGNLGFWKYIDFSDEMGIDKKLKAT